MRERVVSPVEAVEAALTAAEALDVRLHAFLTLDHEQARAAARDAEAAVFADVELPPLHGVPIAIKDLEPTRGLRTTWGTRACRHHVPHADSVLVERLRAAGAIPIGKTNVPAYGLLGETRNRLGPDAANPWNPMRTPGGSSGGSAAAVAAGIVALATGTDAAGSIVCPAAMCGVFGVKPSHGRVPISPHGSGMLLFDAPGPLTRTVEDAVLFLAVTAGRDTRDPVSRRDLPPLPLRVVSESVDGLRIAWSPDLGHFRVDSEVRAVAEAAALAFGESGARVEEAHPDVPDPRSIFGPLYLADTRTSLAGFLSNCRDELFPETVAELCNAPPVSGEEIVRALHGLQLLRSLAGDFFERYDLLLTPSVAVPAFPLGEPPDSIGGHPVEPGWRSFMPFSMLWNLTGQPVASAPAGFTSDGLPVGLQIVAPVGREDLVLAAAAWLEAARPWADVHPPESVWTTILPPDGRS